MTSCTPQHHKAKKAYVFTQILSRLTLTETRCSPRENKVCWTCLIAWYRIWQLIVCKAQGFIFYIYDGIYCTLTNLKTNLASFACSCMVKLLPYKKKHIQLFPIIALHQYFLMWIVKYLRALLLVLSYSLYIFNLLAKLYADKK